MNYIRMQITRGRLGAFWFLLVCVLLICPAKSQPEEQKRQPVVLSAQMENGMLIYKVNGKKVEDSKNNSLLTNLAEIVRARGTEISVLIIIDVRAPFTEVGKLATALDKADLTHDRRLFVADFQTRTMNEIHWDQTAIPIPRN